MYKRDRHQRTNSFAPSDYQADPADESLRSSGAPHTPGVATNRGPAAEPSAPVYVRSTRKARQAPTEQATERQSPPLMFSGGHPHAVTLADSTRVRFWRTPKHLMREIWGTPDSETYLQAAAPVETMSEPDLASIEDIAPEIWPEDEAPERDEAAFANARQSTEIPAEPRSTPFAFLSDHAFWDLVPEIGRDESEVTAPVLRTMETMAWEDDSIADEPWEAEEPILPVVEAAAPVQAMANPGVRTLWSGYSVNLRISMAPQPAALPLASPVVAEAPKALAKAATDLMTTEALEAPVRPVAPAARVRKAPARQAEQPIGFQLPPIEFLAEPPQTPEETMPVEVLQQNAGLLEGVLEDFNVRGEIVQACPGPVVTLYELEPAPGTKSSRVISLADDIARSMSAVSARVAVVQGKNAIGIELPNAKRETVFLRELLASQDFEATKHKLALCLGKTIGGEPVIADLARMPHLLVAGTTGSGKSVAINTMILSILYRLKPEECRLIMVDPKMLELSVYDGIPHLLTPVVTDPKKAVVALKWAVREMEERYKKMSKLSVRNIDGFNARVGEAKAAGEVITRTVQTGFDKHSGEAIYEEEVMDLEPLPYIVVIVDEMADLMMVAGKEIEGTIQRLAQMARAAGIHVVLATQRPSVDVITGTIKANFPTRISFQVTSKIDSRTILGEMGAEQLLGQGDMLYMAGGGRITRVHGPFVSDNEVEKVVAHLKTQGRPQYLDAVTSEEEEAAEDEDGAVFDKTGMGSLDSDDPYEQAVAVVLRDKKASTSYIQRRLQIGYNRAASIMERMENEGIVGPANHAGKREILGDVARPAQDDDE